MLKLAQFPGGRADRAGKTESDFNPRSLRKGMKVEREHFPKNPTFAKYVAEDHLTEDPKYYEKLEVMEKSAFVRALFDEIEKLAASIPVDVLSRMAARRGGLGPARTGEMQNRLTQYLMDRQSGIRRVVAATPAGAQRNINVPNAYTGQIVGRGGKAVPDHFINGPKRLTFPTATPAQPASPMVQGAAAAKGSSTKVERLGGRVSPTPPPAGTPTTIGTVSRTAPAVKPPVPTNSSQPQVRSQVAQWGAPTKALQNFQLSNNAGGHPMFSKMSSVKYPRMLKRSAMIKYTRSKMKLANSLSLAVSAAIAEAYSRR